MNIPIDYQQNDYEDCASTRHGDRRARVTEDKVDENEESGECEKTRDAARRKIDTLRDVRYTMYANIMTVFVLTRMTKNPLHFRTQGHEAMTTNFVRQYTII